ncbi:TlpA family protein disulfide reductase [Sediminicola luteus]|uniref:Thioredoxin domain-containing protein n=1 Tax=Sediminicola luteus TaxID=319238 RepID=A0A2A4GAK8_9FLAO|nr:TlpA disulfide reductase family protein [Sediminicola luteus]PCE65016.1 hypothetical protein B7P33_07625 [Sediminicola luteus]
MKYFALVIVFLFLSCQDVKKKEGSTRSKTIVTGKVLNYDTYEGLRLLKIKPFPGFRRELDVADFSKDGSFRLEFEQEIPQTFRITPFSHTYVYTKPGDSIFVTLDLTGEQKMLIEGDGVEDNVFLNRFYAKKDLGDDLNPRTTLLDGDSYVTTLDSVQEINSNVLNGMLEESMVSRGLRTTLHSELLNERFQRLLKYALYNVNFSERHAKVSDVFGNASQVNGQQSVDGVRYNLTLTESMENDIEQIHVSEGLVENEAFGYTRALYLTYLNKRDNRKIDPNNMTAWLDLTYNSFTNARQRDYALYLFGKSQLENYTLKSFQAQQEHLFSLIQDPSLKERLLKEYVKLKKSGIPLESIEAYSIYDIKQEGVMKILDSLIQKETNKVVLVDFWTSWCAPCHADMVKSGPIKHEKYEGQPIEFVYLQMDLNHKKGNEFIKVNQVSGVHFQFGKEEIDDILKFYAVKAFPTHMIINKQGEVVRKGNYRLYAPKTQFILDSLLKE